MSSYVIHRAVIAYYGAWESHMLFVYDFVCAELVRATAYIVYLWPAIYIYPFRVFFILAYCFGLRPSVSFCTLAFCVSFWLAWEEGGGGASVGGLPFCCLSPGHDQTANSEIHGVMSEYNNYVAR